jgi:thermitase
MKPLYRLLPSLVGLVSASTTFAQALPLSEDSSPYAPGELLVQFKNDVTDQQIADSFRAGGLNLIRHLRTPAMEDHARIGLTHVSTAIPVLQAVRVLNRLPGVEFAEPNWIYNHAAESNDPYYVNGSLWGMFGDDLPSPIGPAGTSDAYGAQAEKAWAAGFTGSKEIFVGIVDEGIQFSHPDLAANIWTNPGEIPGNGIDDDGDGYIDDVHGWNAINDNGTIYDPGYDDHGTHVSGTVGGVGGNGIGVAGVNWNVTLISGKFLGRNGGGNNLDAVQAIDYMTALRTRKGLNIVALNNSWGGTAFSQALLDSISRAAQAGILFTAAAMNATNNNDVSPFYPASYSTAGSAGYDSVIAVAALDSNGNLATFSNYGKNSVDLGAPGVGVYSTVPTDSYAFYKGTSMATPHVTGAIALYASTHPQASAPEVRNTLLTAAVTPTPSLQGKTVTGARLNLSSIITDGQGILPPIPTAPNGLTATALYATRAVIAWTDQSANELGFAIERSSDGLSFSTLDTVGANTATYTDRSVQPNTSYYYRVRAYNPGGSSDYTPIVFVSTAGAPVLAAPVAPSNLTATVVAGISGNQANLSWKDNSSNEDAFQVERRAGNSGSWTGLSPVIANSTTYSDSGLGSHTTYYYRVKAYNSAGSSAYATQISIKTK